MKISKREVAGAVVGGTAAVLLYLGGKPLYDAVQADYQDSASATDVNSQAIEREINQNSAKPPMNDSFAGYGPLTAGEMSAAQRDLEIGAILGLTAVVLTGTGRSQRLEQAQEMHRLSTVPLPQPPTLL